MTTTLKPFRANDDVEPKFRDVALGLLEALGLERNTFFDDAYEAQPLGSVIYALGRHPMAGGVLTEDVFVTSFWAIDQIFTRPGTFEFYLTVFRAIWGEDVAIEFAVPSAGILNISISGVEGTTTPLVFREIVSDVYVHSNFVTEDGDDVLAQIVVGTKNQSEVDALMAEITPVGILATATLIIV